MYPFIDIGGHSIGTYGLCMLTGLFLAGFFSYQKGKANGLLMEDLFIIGAFALGCAIICGGGMYIFVTYPIAQIIQFIQQRDFRFLSSGIVFYGGLIGGILGAFLGIRTAKCPLTLIEHSVVPFIPLGHAIGRIGCVFAGCCHGFSYEGLLALYYPHAVSGVSPNQGYFPVQPLEAILNIGISLILLRLEKKCTKALSLLLSYLSMYAVCRFGLEFFRGDIIRGSWLGLSTSQWISIVLFLFCIVFFIVRRICMSYQRHSDAILP